MPLSLDHCLTSVCDLAGQWQIVHYLVRPTEVLTCLKLPPLNLVRFHACAYEFLTTAPEGVVHGVHRVVMRLSFGVIQRHKVS